MSIDYATLPRTPSGALTAASKRALEAERQERAAASFERCRLDNERRALVLALVEVSELLEAHDARRGTVKVEMITDREEAIGDARYAEGVMDGADEAIENNSGRAQGALEIHLHRIRTLGLDAELSTLEILERIEKELAA